MITISKEIILDEFGQDIGTKEIRNEVIDHLDCKECITREIIKLHKNRIVLDHVIHRSEWTKIE